MIVPVQLNTMYNAQEAKAVSDILNESMVNMSITYAKEYKANPKNFLNTYKKYDSIRTAAAFIVGSYKQIGAFDECKESGKDFTEYANKHFSGEEARVFAEFLLIIYSIINQ